MILCNFENNVVYLFSCISSTYKILMDIMCHKNNQNHTGTEVQLYNHKSAPCPLSPKMCSLRSSKLTGSKKL